MKKYVCVNGEFLDAEHGLFGATNRAFRYGDALFETFLVRGGHVCFVDDHFERLVAGMFSLGFETTLFNPMQVYEEMLHLCARNQMSNARVRLCVFRNAGNSYRPLNDSCSYLISAEELPHAHYEINSKGLRLGLFSELRKPVNSLAAVKSANALIYVLAARHARDNSWDEAILLNEHGRVCEASASNLFMVLPGRRILTPPVTEGILPGVMRKNLLKWLPEAGYQVEEAILLPDDFYRAEEIFLSNVIQGIRWALSFRERRYFATVSKEIAARMNEEILA